MEDIAPKLLESIKKDFEKEVENNSVIRKIQNKIRDGTAELEEMHDYAEHLGHSLSLAFKANITIDSLPDGRMYWNIANRTIRPMLENNYYLTNEAASEVLKIADAKDGIGLNPVKGNLPNDRIKGLMDKMCEEDLEYEQMIKWVDEPVVNCSESFFDDFIVANADFRQKAGMSPVIVRKAEPSRIVRSKKGRYRIPCKWCRNLEGTYNYSDLETGSDVYRRHEFCRCVVTFRNGKKAQDVWSKIEWTSDDNLKTFNKDVVKLTTQQAQALEKQLDKTTENGGN